jgi:hypothetical protein
MFQDFALRIKGLLAGDGMAASPRSERTDRSPCNTFQARNRLCFDASSSSSKSWIAFGVIDTGVSVHTHTNTVKKAISLRVGGLLLYVVFSSNENQMLDGNL